MNREDVETHSDAPLVLVVDDDPTTRMLLRESLQAGGFEVVEAADGEAARVQYDAHAPGLILLDVVMPGMDGLEVCATICSRPGGAHVPILMATSLEDVASINRAYEVGATDFVTKPISWSLLAHRARYMVRSTC
jgi:PleD family two-component response regulator